jgi:wyosine [tRNA(Phe)-imidazoG37] synthetase (radical SAM superfamily)
MNNHIAFGPVPSRRLGRSLGINNIPPKVCTYSCIYCQLGCTINRQVERRAFYEPSEIQRAVGKQIESVTKTGEHIDYLTFVPDGEPTLDINLGREIDLLKPLGIKIAVITNNSLIWRPDVREDLLKADWVSLKIDSMTSKTWHQINQPIKSLRFGKITNGTLEFGKTYDAELTTETMLVRNVNDNEREVKTIAGFLAELGPAKTYLSIPTRPPALRWVHVPPEENINRAYQILHERIDPVEYLIGYEGNAFASTGNIEKDLLSITAVHPMREEAVNKLVSQTQRNWDIVHKMIAENKLTVAEYAGTFFYMRKLNQSDKHGQRRFVRTL